MIFKQKSLIVSCQAEGNDPFNSPEGVAMFAKAAEMGGAHGIRSEGIEKTKKIINEVSIPVIGLIKSSFGDGSVRITGTLNEVEELLDIGCKIIAVDGTNRIRDEMTGPQFISLIKQKYCCSIMADISTINEAIESQKSGADYISTTLNGYTPETINDNNGEPNYLLINTLSHVINLPIFAEGRISSPGQAKKMIELGAYGVVVGTIITRPRVITQMFTNIMK